MTPNVSVVIPVYNEDELLREVVTALVAEMDRRGLNFQLVLSENGSTDGTVELVNELAKSDERIQALHLPYPDYGDALRNAFLAGKCEALANFSADWIDLDFMCEGLSRLDRCDMVLGSKTTEKKGDSRPLQRRLGGWFFHEMTRAVFRLPVMDTHGLKVMRRATVQPVIHACRVGGEVFDSEMVVRAHRRGLKLCEVALQVRELRPSRVGIVKRAGRALVQTARLRVALWSEGIN